MDPVTLAAIISGGSQLVGGGISGIGAGISAAKKAEEERKAREREQANLDREFRQTAKIEDQTMGMKGIELLAALQAQAVAQFKGQRFRDAVYNSLRG